MGLFRGSRVVHGLGTLFFFGILLVVTDFTLSAHDLGSPQTLVNPAGLGVSRFRFRASGNSAIPKS